ncbi:MAG: autotransporter-associated beta strand repeat-containing protein, partial [Verrucomicrobia bacterium]|nr:autotransporter-associated beta strand repeat-containing protein [Verrucomicrobiota bacterium]
MISLSGLVLDGDRTISLGNNNNLTISSLISETGGSRALIKNDAGTVSLTNTANSFTGAFSAERAFVNISSLQPSGTNSSIGAGNTINFGSTSFQGTLTLSAGAVAPSGVINRTINLATGNGGTFGNDSSNPVTFNGGFTVASGTKTFTLQGSNTGANDFQSTIVNPTTSGTIGFSKAGSGNWTLSGPNTYTGITIIQAGTLNVATIADSGSSNLGLGTTMRFGNTTTTGTLNYTGSGNSTVRTIQIGSNNTTTPANTDTGGATINNNGTSGALIFSASTFNAQQTNAATGVGANRVLTLGGSNTAANEISGIIQNNLVTSPATGTATVGVTKANAGRWILAGANIYTGTTTVSGGVLQLNSATALPGGIGATGGTSGLTLSGGVLGLGNGNFTRALGAGVDQVQLTADSSGFAAYGADRIVNLGGTSTALTWGSGSFMTTGSTLVLSHPTATHTLDFQNPIAFGTTLRTFRVENGAATVDARLSGAITSGAATAFAKAGAGTLELTNTGNAWTNLTYIDSGTLRLGAADVLPGITVELKRGLVASDTNPILDLNGFSDTI